jgi:hypothetical protein
MPQRTQVQVEEMDPMALVDYVFERLALPKPGPALRFIAPKSILKSLGIKTLDEITEEALEKIRAELKTRRII